MTCAIPDCQEEAIHEDHPLCLDHAADLIIAAVQASGPKKEE